MKQFSDSCNTFICQQTQATKILRAEHIQTLWGGYGVIQRVYLEHSAYSSVVVKHISYPKHVSESSVSHNRKVKSYQVEIEWYTNWNTHNMDLCKTPICLGVINNDSEILIILEDLHASLYTAREHSLSISQMRVCIDWLANFHAFYVQKESGNLWETGTYWHLATRPEELKALDDMPLQKAAQSIDKKLQNATYQTIVHGDAKLQNFCFTQNLQSVAAVDFQYVGKGVGVKDLIYFVGSCLSDPQAERHEKEILAMYFTSLENALQKFAPTINSKELIAEWESLYHVAWTDFHRFYKGWTSNYWNSGMYSEKLKQKVLQQFKNA